MLRLFILPRKKWSLRQDYYHHWERWRFWKKSLLPVIKVTFWPKRRRLLWLIRFSEIPMGRLGWTKIPEKRHPLDTNFKISIFYWFWTVRLFKNERHYPSSRWYLDQKGDTYSDWDQCFFLCMNKWQSYVENLVFLHENANPFVKKS